jgi:Uma2 family endonuclease
MQTLTLAPSCLTVKEYLLKESQADEKSELIEGVLVPMAGASANHNRIVINFSRLLPPEIPGQTVDIFISDMRLGLPDYATYTYPDIVVVRGEPQFQSPKQTEVLNPCLLVEVLSPSTDRYDKTDKFRLYRSLPSLEEYLLISQTDYLVQQYTKVDDRRWLLQDWIGLEAIFTLSSLGVEIALQDLYKRVSF